MQTSKTAKSILNGLPLLAVMIAAVISMFVAKDLPQPSLVSGVKETAQLFAEQYNPQLMIISGAGGPCISPYIYTSLPPKCRTSNGEFTPLPGTSPNVFVIPGGK